MSAVAKALRDFARNNPALVIKGGLLDGASLSAAELTSLADLPSRDVLLARLAGAIAAPLQTASPACSRRCPATSPTACPP